MNTEQPAASQTVSHTAPQEDSQSPTQTRQQAQPTANSVSSPPNNTAQPQGSQQRATPAASTVGEGNVPSSIPAARDGPTASPVPAGFVPVVQYRGPDGRIYKEPAKKQLEDSSSSKAQSSAPTDSRKPLQRNDLEQADALKGGIQGLDSIPKDWPELPGNVSLGQEIAWVQANRLYVVKEQATGRIKVDLSKARVPAPSAAALSWLETSIRSYAKFVEVASKQAGSGQDEAELRKERMQIGEIRSILAEMLVDKVN